jgi:hypothetical protein
MAPTTVEEKIQVIQQKTGSGRKAAIRKLKASQRGAHKAEVSKQTKAVASKSAAANDKAEIVVPKVSKKAARIALNQRGAMKPEAVKQYEEMAAPTAPAPVVPAPVAAKPAKAAKPPAAPKPMLTKEQVFAIRRAGVQQYQLAGRPKAEDVILVYGPNGMKMTWPQREAAGVSAVQFQAALAARKAAAK